MRLIVISSRLGVPCGQGMALAFLIASSKLSPPLSSLNRRSLAIRSLWTSSPVSIPLAILDAF